MRIKNDGLISRIWVIGVWNMIIIGNELIPTEMKNHWLYFTDSNRNEESLAVFWFMFISINHQSTLFLYLYWMEWNEMEWIILEWSDEAFGNDKCSKYTKCQSSYNWNEQNWIWLLWFNVNAKNGSIESIENYLNWK